MNSSVAIFLSSREAHSASANFHDSIEPVQLLHLELFANPLQYKVSHLRTHTMSDSLAIYCSSTRVCHSSAWLNQSLTTLPNMETFLLKGLPIYRTISMASAIVGQATYLPNLKVFCRQLPEGSRRLIPASLGGSPFFSSPLLWTNHR